MAVEWALGAGIAVVKVVLRLYGDPDVADMVDDTVGGVGSFRTKPKRKDLGRVFAARIDADVPARLRAKLSDHETAAAAQIAADVVAGLADQPAALATALARPEEFPEWVREHGGFRARQNFVATHAEDLYDAVLASASKQLVMLAPTAQRAVSAGMAEALQQLVVVMTKLDDIHESVRRVDLGVQDLLQRPVGQKRPGGQKQISWPVVPRPAPARAQAYQDRDVSAGLPTSGTVVLSGSSGFGKTQIAAEVFASSVADLRLWVSAGSRDQVLSGYADAAVAVGIADAAEGVEERATRFLGWLTAPPEDRSWLVVLDDLTDHADLAATDTQPGCWPPVTASGLTLVTTLFRAALLSNEGRRLQRVDHYSRPESVNYLTRRFRDHAADLPVNVLDQADGLAEDMGDHPLALSQAAAVIITDQITIADYRLRFAAETLDQVLPETARADGYTWSLQKAFQLALDRAASKSLDATKLLTFLGTLDPAGAPRELLDTHVVRGYIDATAQEIQAALLALRELSLTSHIPSLGPLAIRTHPLTGRLAREHAGANRVIEAGKVAASALVDIWPDDKQFRELAAVLRANARMLQILDSQFDNRLLWSDEVGQKLLFRYQSSLRQIGLRPDAAALATYLRDTSTAEFGADHPVTLAARYALLLAWPAEDPSARVSETEGLLEDMKRFLGDDDEYTFATRLVLSSAIGESRGARFAVAVLKDLLNDAQSVADVEDTLLFDVRSALAYWLGESGDYVGALSAYGKLREDMENALGYWHRDTSTVRFLFEWWERRAWWPGDP